MSTRAEITHPPGDIVVGLVDAVIGGFLFGLLVTGDAWFWGSIVAAFLGACLLLLLVRFVTLKRTRLDLQPILLHAAEWNGRAGSGSGRSAGLLRSLTLPARPSSTMKQSE